MNINEIIKSDIRASLAKSGILLFLAGFMIFMGIITGEIFYKSGFTTRDSYISELATSVSPEGTIDQPSASIFNYTMIISGIMVIIAAWFIQNVFKKYLSTIPLFLLGIGLSGVGIFPGNIVPWHFLFALVIFICGGIAAITSFKIVISPLRYIFISLGIIALVFLIFNKVFTPALGAGGAERWLFYPIVFWVTGMGAYLLGIKDGHKNTLSANH